MGKSKKNTQTSNQTGSATTSFDPLTQSMRGQVYGAAGAQANTPQPMTNGMLQNAGVAYGDATGGLNTGMNTLAGTAGDAQYGAHTLGQAAQAGGGALQALSGNAQAAQQYMNPYQSQVMAAQDASNQHESQMVTQGIDSQATASGAFGGSRQGVAEGVAQANMARDQMAQRANLLSSGYGQAMQQAGQVAGYGQNAGSQLFSGGNAAANNLTQTGLAGAQGQMGAGDYQRQAEIQNQQNPLNTWLKAAGGVPNGTTVSTNQQGNQSQTQGGNLFGDILGAAGVASSFFPGGGKR